jgi:hypothetical protein
MASGPPQPDLTLFIVIKAPYFVHFNMDSDVFAEFSMLFIHTIYFFLSFFNSLTTVSRLAPNSRAAARIPIPDRRPFGYGFLYQRLAARIAAFRITCLREHAGLLQAHRFSPFEGHRLGHLRFRRTDISTPLPPYLPPTESFRHSISAVITISLEHYPLITGNAHKRTFDAFAGI